MYPLTPERPGGGYALSRAVEPATARDRRQARRHATCLPCVSRPRGISGAATGNDGHAMIDSTFSSPPGSTAAHVDPSLSRCWRRKGSPASNCSKAVASPPPTCSTWRLISPRQEQQVFVNASPAQRRAGPRPALRTRFPPTARSATRCFSAPTLGEALRIGLSYPVLAPTSTCREVADGRAWLVATGWRGTRRCGHSPSFAWAR